MHRWMGCFVTVLGLVSTAELACAGAFVASEAQAKFCGELLKRLNAGDSADKALARIEAKSPSFLPGKLTFQTSRSGRRVTEAIEYAEFDIDNDGRDETLVKYLTSLRGAYGELVWIVRQNSELDFENGVELSQPQYSALDAVESITPWPYESRGLFLVKITPFELEGVKYFGIRDTYFGDRSFQDRSWVIAKFRGRKLGPGGFGHETDDFHTVCSFRSAAR